MTGDDVDSVSDLIRSATTGDRAAITEVGKLRDADALPLLLAALPDATGQVTLAIIAALGRIKGDEAAAALAQFLDPFFHEPGRHLHDPSLHGDEYWTERGHSNDRRLQHMAASDALRKISTPLARDILAANNCHYELARRRDPRAAEIALRYLRPPAFDGARTLAKLRDPTHLPALRQAQAEATKPGARFTLVVARLRCGDTSAIDELHQIASDAEHPRRRNAQIMLKRDPDVRAALEQSSTDE